LGDNDHRNFILRVESPKVFGCLQKKTKILGLTQENAVDPHSVGGVGVKVKIKQSSYRPGVAKRVPGS
jgi:hypothetical protein